MRAVVDTNILLSALIRPGGLPDLVVRAWLGNRFVLVTHEIQIDELRIASGRIQLRSRIRRAEAGLLVNQMREKAEFVRRLPRVSRSVDPLDDYLLALSDAGQADYLVTGDKAGLLDLGTHETTQIMTARRFLDRLGISG